MRAPPRGRDHRKSRSCHSCADRSASVKTNRAVLPSPRRKKCWHWSSPTGTGERGTAVASWGAPHRDRWRSWLSHAGRSTTARPWVEARRLFRAIQRERCEPHEGTPMRVNPVTSAKPKGLVLCHQTCPHRRDVGVRLLQPYLVERTGRAAQHRAVQSRHASKARCVSRGGHRHRALCSRAGG